MNVSPPTGALLLRPQDCQSLQTAEQFFRQGEIALNHATSIEQTVSIRNTAAAAGIYYRQVQRSIESQNQATILRIRAEQKLGALLIQLQLRGGNRKSVPHSNRLTLTDYGISRYESKRDQKLAAISSEQLTRVLDEFTAQGREITIAGVFKATQPAKPKPVRKESGLPPAPAEPGTPAESVTPSPLPAETPQKATAFHPDVPAADCWVLSMPDCQSALEQLQESLCHLEQAISMMDNESPGPSVSGQFQPDSFASKPAMHPRHYVQEAQKCVRQVKTVLARKMRHSTR